MNLESLRTLKKDYQEKIKSAGENALKEHFKQFFVANPKITAVKWAQYTPYFNDGEPCEFRVNDVYVKIVGFEEHGGHYNDGFLMEYDLDKNGPHAHERKAIVDLYAILSDMEDVLQAVLGDHSEITITPTKVNIEEYSHD